MQLIKKIGIVISLALLPTVMWGQKLSTSEMEAFKKSEDSLAILVDSIRGAIVLDERIDYGYQFISQLKQVLNRPNSFHYPFDKLKDKMHIINAPDGNFRIFNWVVANSNFNKTYFGAIQLSNQKLIPLVDYSDNLEEKGKENSITSNKEWYGGEYYNIIKDDYNGRPVYLLLGFNSNSNKFNRKFIDVLSFDGENVSFGAPIFRVANRNGAVGLQNRFILYYKKNVTTMLNWDASVNMLVFTRLESEINAPSRLDTYVPAGPIDGLKKENNIWLYRPGVLNILQLQDGRAPIDGVMN